MAEGKLKTVATYSVEQFKNLTMSEVIRVAKNPNTNKLFFTYGEKGELRGAVAGNSIPSRPCINKVEDEKGTTFYILSEDNALAVL